MSVKKIDLKVGDRVIIHTRFHGIYDKKKGRIVEAANNDSFYRVRFDVPIECGSDLTVKADIFFSDELERIGDAV